MASELQSILALEVPIIVALGGRQMKMSEVCALMPGAIIELPKSAEEELTLQVNNKPVGAGLAVKVGENFGIKITYIGDIKARIAALGAATKAPPSAEASGETDLESLAEAMLSGQM